MAEEGKWKDTGIPVQSGRKLTIHGTLYFVLQSHLVLTLYLNLVASFVCESARRVKGAFLMSYHSNHKALVSAKKIPQDEHQRNINIMYYFRAKAGQIWLTFSLLMKYGEGFFGMRHKGLLLACYAP